MNVTILPKTLIMNNPKYIIIDLDNEKLVGYDLARKVITESVPFVKLYELKDAIEDYEQFLEIINHILKMK